MPTATLIRAFIALGFLLVGILTYLLLSSHNQRAPENGEWGGDFVLRSVDGDVSLTDFPGQVVVLYFGFLNCPHVCPASMSVLQKTLHDLDADELKQVQAIFISVDPERDSYPALASFSASFHSKILGVTGTRAQIDRVTQNYAAYNRVKASDTADSEYAFRHSSRFYIVNQEGKLVDAMRHSTTSNELLARIKSLI